VEDRGQPDSIPVHTGRPPIRRNCNYGPEKLDGQTPGHFHPARTWATDQQLDGMAVSLAIDRVTAARLGITAPTDRFHASNDAFGQRQVSTLFTQLNQYHLVLEAMPAFQKNPRKLNDIYVPVSLRRLRTPQRVRAFLKRKPPRFPSTTRGSFRA